MLESLGILTVGALAAAPAPTLEPVFGAQNAHVLRATALGVASDVVTAGADTPKSISRETTFPEDLSDWNLLGNAAAQLLEHCAHALREDGLQATVAALRELAPQTLVPCHCTGEAAVRRLCDDLGASVTPGAAGMTFWY